MRNSKLTFYNTFCIFMTLIFNSINSVVVGINDQIFRYSCDRKIEFVEEGLCKS